MSALQTRMACPTALFPDPRRPGAILTAGRPDSRPRPCTPAVKQLNDSGVLDNTYVSSGFVPACFQYGFQYGSGWWLVSWWCLSVTAHGWMALRYYPAVHP